MRVLMQNRFDAYRVYGGDTAQMLKTQEHLKRLGVDVSISLEATPDLSGYDIVHLFNITRIHETYVQFKNAKKQNKKIALSTIYIDFTEYDKKGRYGMGGLLAGSLKKDYFEVVKYLADSGKDVNSYSAIFRMLKVGYANQQKEVLAGAHILLPNSEMEYKKIVEDFNITNRYVVVPNGIDQVVCQDECVFGRKEDAVLCVGRIEPRKNQLNLVRALKGTGIKLYLAGKVHKKQKRYGNKVLKGLEEINGTYLGHPKELGSVYAKVKVHCLPSWFETTGLVSLEAALYGCSVVSTDRGFAYEYLGDDAWYCSPDDTASIRDAIMQAMKAPLNTRLRDTILEKYTWQNAARKTLEAYEQIL